MLFSFAALVAQEKGEKNTKPIKYNKETNNNEVKPNKFTKVIITPTSSNNSNRASQSQNDQLRPEKPVKEERVINNRASQSQNDQLRPEKPVREKEERVINNRASQSQNDQLRPEKVKEKRPRKEKPRKEK